LLPTRARPRACGQYPLPAIDCGNEGWQSAQMIRVQQQAFDVGHEISDIKAGKNQIGGTAVFVGTVRDIHEGAQVSALTLEHYPGMTEKALADIETEARSRWALEEVLIVHRYGLMQPGDDIVLVICCSLHRDNAFDACRFLMDFLKTKAPFWKLEAGADKADWVDARESDDLAAARWLEE
jgi:molybdopterin synthase catalytic subunit